MALLFFLLPVFVIGQNLVPNADFEQKNGCPDRPGQISLAKYWVSANMGTPDYFNDCSSWMEYGTEFNKKGGQIAHSGKAYAGLQFYNLNRNEYFEYIETKLDTTMTAGVSYCIKAWVSLGETPYAFRQLGVLFSVNEVRSGDTHPIRLPFTSLSNGQYLTDQEQWMCIKGIYKAKGNERVMTIGSFPQGDEFWNIQTQSATDSLSKSAFYFIDDVSVEAIKDPDSCICLKNK